MMRPTSTLHSGVHTLAKSDHPGYAVESYRQHWHTKFSLFKIRDNKMDQHPSNNMNMVKSSLYEFQFGLRDLESS
ncbi:hypothetical protein V6N11_011858 [Hibiscus sabdariffa]|uniref:Uncharacterized protein n=1 Tax=Hibiscus sabdariffa TaxID=183260 RepID=A0ABR2SAA8_9ROSI